MNAQAAIKTYFLPDDWVLAYRARDLVATKLSTAESVTVEGDIADALVTKTLRPSTWAALASREPLLGELQRQLGTHELTELNRASLLKGAGWRQLFIELTARCNERCVHCYADSSPERDECLGLNEIRALLDDAKTLGFELVQLTGGDPLVSPHCVPAAEYARRIGIPKLEVYTNGLALRGKVYERLRELAVSFAFSFYSHDASRHDAITRTPGSHQRTTRAIRRAVQDGLSVRTGTIIMDENELDAKDTRAYLVQLGVKGNAIGMDRSRAVGRGDLHHPPMHRELQGRPVERNDQGRGGSRPFGGTAAVSPDGVVYPCIFGRHLALGSIRQKSLRAILSAPEPVAAPTAQLIAKRTAWAARLSCWECQTRSQLLGASIDA